MARTRKATETNRIQDPAQFYIALQNNGKVTVYDKQKAEALTDAQAKKAIAGEFIYIGKAFFKYKLVTKGGEVQKDIRSGIYKRKSDTVRAYDSEKKDENNRPEMVYEGPAGELEEYNTGAYIWALNKAGDLCRFELSSTGLTKWIEHDNLCLDAANEPDFSVTMQENPDFGSASTMGKFFPVFSFADIESDSTPIEQAEKELNDFFSRKGVGEVKSAKQESATDPAETPNFA